MVLYVPSLPMRRVIDQQVRTLMDQMNRHGAIGRAAMKAGMDRSSLQRHRIGPSVLDLPNQHPPNFMCRELRERPEG